MENTDGWKGQRENIFEAIKEFIACKDILFDDKLRIIFWMGILGLICSVGSLIDIIPEISKRRKMV